MLTHETIQTIAAFGYEVYAPDGSLTYVFYTDATRVAYLQEDRFGGFSVHSCHIPNRTTGTGFLMVECNLLTQEVLERGFAIAPEWAVDSQRATVRKWRNIDHMINTPPVTRLERVA